MRIFFLAFLLVPLAEIYLLISVGGAIGVGWTIALVVFTALAGAALVRAQGFATLARARAQLARGQPPALEMLEGLLLFAAGALLLTPGFFTDAVGFALLLPPLRRGLIGRVLGGRVFGVGFGGGPGVGHGDHGDYGDPRNTGDHGDHGDPGDRDRAPGRQPGRVIDADYEKLD
ncbi:MAG: FxsA family protein [Gammaproteobacteria bacterium]|nr:FxsA family protein [Gammaproteobacteria bacterium]